MKRLIKSETYNLNISVNCPSYKRPKVESLQYLPYVKVWVDHKEYDEYLRANKGFEKNIISCPEGIQGNVSRIRNYILDQEFKNGADVVVIIDDDLKGIYSFEVNENGYAYDDVLINAEEFPFFIAKYTLMCEELGYKLWGVNLNKDALNYKHALPFNTKAIILGPFSCHLKNDIRYDEELPLKEDYDLAIQHLNKYRGILRVNKCHYNCKQSTNAGGCATYRNYDREEQQLKALQEKWGTDIVKRDKSTMAKSKKKKVNIDYNPIIKIPIKGV